MQRCRGRPHACATRNSLAIRVTTRTSSRSVDRGRARAEKDQIGSSLEMVTSRPSMLEQPGAKGAGPRGSSERQPKPKAEHSPWAVRRLCSGRPQASAFCAAEGGLCPAPASRRDALASDREAANLAGHGRLTASFAFDFACPCLISLMRTSRAERVCGNLPLVSFASWICFGLRTGASEFRGAQA